MLKLDRTSAQAISIKNYEIRNSRFDYMHILEYLCRVSFLTTLDIYKDYFKGHQKVMQGEYTCIVQPLKKPPNIGNATPLRVVLDIGHGVWGKHELRMVHWNLWVILTHQLAPYPLR